MQHTHIFNGTLKNVFSRFTNAILLDFNQKSTTFNTSYAQPIGTEFKYIEESFGQKLQYTATITGYDKPNLFSYRLENKFNKFLITCSFTESNQQTTVSYSIILENPNIFQRFITPKTIKDLEKKFETYITYTTKIIEA